MSHYVPQYTDTSMALGATTTYSQPVAVKTGDNIGLAVRTAGTASGTWSVLYSNDYNPNVDSLTDMTKWDTYNPTGFTAPTAASGSAQKLAVVLDSYEFAWVRLQFTGSGGSGTSTLIWQMKGS